jgi:HlyD family secretion protein
MFQVPLKASPPNSVNPGQLPDPNQILGIGPLRQRRKWIFLTILLLVLALVVSAVGLLLARQHAPIAPHFETAEVSQGDLRVTITATGTLSARDTVPVGAEISGRVIRVLVDYNDKVEPDQILAEIDPEQYRARRDDAQAQLALAKAALLSAQATLRESDLKVRRLRPMRTAGLSSQQDLETAEATLDRANASLTNAKAQITSAEASLKVALSNLSKTIIRSPITGVVLERSVEPGQTVTSGLQTPVLFTLAADLAEMRLAVKVDEADVGQVQPGLPATFTVDAYPNRVFDSTVLKVKNMSTTSQNVVTYETRLSVKNTDGMLRPGMTATATIAIESKKNALLVPNAALRYSPKLPPAPGAPGAGGGFSIGRLMPPPPGGGPRQPPSSDKAGPPGANASRVFILRDDRPEPVPVEVSATDGVRTAIRGPGIAPGVRVILGEDSASLK